MNSTFDEYGCALNNCTCIENSVNITENPWEYIACFYGPQMQELAITLLITVINGIIFVTGLLGNIAVCIVIIKQPTLQTATNYYLFNLAVSDVTLLVFGLPNDVAMYWHQYPWPLGLTFCKFRALISETASYVSVLTVVAFSMERYIAICHPLHLRAIAGLQRAIWIIAGLWIVSFIFALPFAIYTNITYVFYPYNSTNIVKESAMCAMVAQPEHIPLTEMSSIIFFIVPMIIIAVLYTNMAITIAKASDNRLSNNIKGSIHRKNKRTQTNKSIIRMLSLVVLGFFICWAPFHAQRLMTIYFRDSPIIERVNYWMYFITGICYYFSSTLNPILYNVMSEKMRSAFKEIVCCINHTELLRRNATFRETSNTYISMMPNNDTANLHHHHNQHHHHHHHHHHRHHTYHNHYQCNFTEDDILLSKDSVKMLFGENNCCGKNNRFILYKNGSIKNKILEETGV